jgi:hypothetical protein
MRLDLGLIWGVTRTSKASREHPSLGNDLKEVPLQEPYPALLECAMDARHQSSNAGAD